MTPTVPITVQSDPAGFRADAILPTGTSVTVTRSDREVAIRDAANTVHRIAAEQGMRVVTSLPFCQPSWSRPYWELPAFRQYDPGTVDGDAVTLPTATQERQDGSVPLPVDDQTEGL